MKILIPIHRALNQTVSFNPLPMSGDGEPEIRGDGLVFDARLNPTKPELVRTWARTIREFLEHYRAHPESHSAFLHWQKMEQCATLAQDALPHEERETAPNMGWREPTAHVGHEIALKELLDMFWIDWRKFIEKHPKRPGGRPSRAGLELLDHIAKRVESLAPKFADPVLRRQESIDLRTPVRDADQTVWIRLAVAIQRFNVSARALRYAITKKLVRFKRDGPRPNSPLRVAEADVASHFPARHAA